ncbi:MAG TPA: hypothetical protein VGS41_08750, partial [Chthonomonadales bacterium]|nr:hypothetical protein [Chthonomonadales bacterium]
MVEATPVLTRPVRAVSGAEAGTEEFLLALAARMASRFKVPRPVEVFEFAEKGNINHHTYLVTAGRERDGQQYLLQRINRAVFTQPVRVMRAMIASIEAQRASLARTSLPDDLDWQVI